jgi:hypothetical protein
VPDASRDFGWAMPGGRGRRGYRWRGRRLARRSVYRNRAAVDLQDRHLQLGPGRSQPQRDLAAGGERKVGAERQGALPGLDQRMARGVVTADRAVQDAACDRPCQVRRKIDDCRRHPGRLGRYPRPDHEAAGGGARDFAHHGPSSDCARRSTSLAAAQLGWRIKSGAWWRIASLTRISRRITPASGGEALRKFWQARLSRA